MNIYLLNIDLPYIYKYILGKCKFNCSVFPALLSCASHPFDICTVAIKYIRNTHAVWTSQTADILNFKGYSLYILAI